MLKLLPVVVVVPELVCEIGETRVVLLRNEVVDCCSVLVLLALLEAPSAAKSIQQMIAPENIIYTRTEIVCNIDDLLSTRRRA